MGKDKFLHKLKEAHKLREEDRIGYDFPLGKTYAQLYASYSRVKQLIKDLEKKVI